METNRKVSFNELWGKYGTLSILIILIALLAIIKPTAIFSATSVPQILTQSSVNILLALGEFFAILIAGIDLSVGSVAALVGMVTAKLMVGGVNPVLAVALGIFLGAFLGFLNGTVINKTGVHPFIITLGSQAIFRGITLIISNARSVFGFPVSFTKFISNRVFGIPVPVLIALSVAAVLIYFTTKTKVGRNIYALGGNKEAAWYSGINIKLHTLLVFIISGTASAIAGIVLLGRVGAAEPAAGTGFETYAIAAAIIGGTSFFGGKGKIFGVVIGGLIIGLINYGMTVLTVPSSYQQIVMGGLIIISVTIDMLLARKK
ncbi:D-allose ABC transporter permease [Proteiniclasticum sp. QWL-01]|uniref:D-allose ABC transporter permease n=1 Tax=Proteiniclasticum sp. QWL-01 TaxID=3036945 RepID=UPI0022056AC2|nr:D-allose ABC transporter permease [Proteiniclasticum sp. QWL-01]UUM12815.1 D-allose ABC transporter permease [Clostridiaceae bacterium HFYG-1003]WFF74372.1 D-allose ABC transporter permease [Proteiniclasticum sp. QWL-01]